MLMVVCYLTDDENGRERGVWQGGKSRESSGGKLCIAGHTCLENHLKSVRYARSFDF